MRSSPSGSNTIWFAKPTQHDIPVKKTKSVEFWKATISWVRGFMGVLQTQEDRQLSEGDQATRGLVMSDLAGVFLIGLVSAAVGFAFDTPVPPPDG